MHGRVADDAAFADLGAARLELRFHERDDVGAGAEQRRHDRQDVAERDERDVDRDDVERRAVAGQIAARERARVDALDHVDARIAADLPVELAVADVERDDARGAALQQHVGEAAGRGADVERRRVPATSMPNVSSACASLRPPRPTYG